jgi:outer membrane immunogenic protein
MKKSISATKNNRMKLNILIATISSCAFTPLAIADTTSGPYIGLGAGFYNTNLTAKNGAVVIHFGDDKLDAGLDIFAGYKWNSGAGSVSVELGYVDNYGKLGTFSGGTDTLRGEMEGGASISILPGYQLSKDTMIFARLGYAHAKGTMTIAGTLTGTSSLKFKDWMYGFGIEHALSPKFAIRAEYKVLDNMSKLNGTTTLEPRATGGNLALKYAF